MDRKTIINKFILDFAAPGRRLTNEEIINYRDYGLGIKDDRVFKEVFDVGTYAGAMGYMPAVSRMRYVQREIEHDRLEDQRQEEAHEDIATPEEIHAIIQETLKTLGATPKKKAPVQKPDPGNLMDALPEHLKGLDEHKGTDAEGMPF